MTGNDDDRSARKGAPAAPGVSVRAPVAGLLVDTAVRPGRADLVALARHTGAFAVTDQDAAAGFAELMHTGVAFDCHGLVPAARRRLDTAVQTIDLPLDFAVIAQAFIGLNPGAAVAGAAHALPVVRMLSELMIALTALPGITAVVWLPARLAVSPGWFAQAVGKWLDGGPFPALALTGLTRTAEGLVSSGLNFFTGQDFVWLGSNGAVAEHDMRGAMRLIDWMVAHGRIDASCEAVLTGFGTVRLVPVGIDRVQVHRL